MALHRHALTNARLLVRVTPGQQYRFTLSLLGQRAPPRLDDGRMAVGFATTGVQATLVRRQ